MFKKIISSLILFIAMISCISYAANTSADQWQWYYSDANQTLYFNPASVTYDKKSNTAKVWDKCVMSNGMAPKNYIKIDFSNKTDQLIGYINSGETEVLLPKSKPNNEIGPGTPSEALANAVADQLKIPHIYKGGAERWQWFHSTDTESYYIATDATSYNTKTNLYSVWIKTVRATKGSNYPIHYVFDFTNHTWGFSSFNHMKTVEPDSWQEIIYNGAYDLCKKLYGLPDKESPIDNFGFLSTQQTE